MVASAGAPPQERIAPTSPSAVRYSANTSPPRPVLVGSTTLSAAAVATAASKALPPSRNNWTPASAASGWLVATRPLGAWTVERRDEKRSGSVMVRGCVAGVKNDREGAGQECYRA